jgi:hypothetical protein
MSVAEAIRDRRGLLMPERLAEAAVEAAQAGLIHEADADRLLAELGQMP